MSTLQDRWLEQKLTEERQREDAAAEQAERLARHAERDRQLAAIEARYQAMTPAEQQRFDHGINGLIRHYERIEQHKREDDFVPGFEENPYQ
jgi:hypothetical protein